MNKLIYFTKDSNWGEVAMKILTSVASILLIIGAINWGLVGLFNLDLVETLFRSRDTMTARVLYSLVGLSGVYTILYLIF